VLPDWLDPSTLRTVSAVGIVAMLVAALVVARLVQKMVIRVVVLGIAVGLAAGVWAERAELGDCARTCDCRFFGLAVEPPAAVRERCASRPLESDG
jgi:uncharacterized membrane protein